MTQGCISQDLKGPEKTSEKRTKAAWKETLLRSSALSSSPLRDAGSQEGRGWPGGGLCSVKRQSAGHTLPNKALCSRAALPLPHRAPGLVNTTRGDDHCLITEKATFNTPIRLSNNTPIWLSNIYYSRKNLKTGWLLWNSLPPVADSWIFNYLQFTIREKQEPTLAKKVSQALFQTPEETCFYIYFSLLLKDS